MTEALIPQTDGAIFGNLDHSSFAGNAAMFDGNAVNNYPAVGAYHLGSPAYIGKAYSTARRPARALIYGWNDRGLIDDGSSGVVYLYGKNSAPSSATDGAVLGQTSFTEPSGVAYGAAVEVVSNDRTTAYTHLWVCITHSATGVAGAEAQFYEATEEIGEPQQYVKPLAIFLGAGQSNMRGDAPIPDQAVYANRARVKSFALDGAVKQAADPLMETTGSQWPQYSDANPKCGTLMPFGNSIATLLANFDVMLVNSSKGGTTIEEWAKGQPLYDGMIQRANAALVAAPAGSFIAGFVWQQGESNTSSEASATGWVTQFKALVQNVRDDLEIADLPVVMIGLGPYDSFGPGWPQLRFAQQYMALPTNSTYVKTFDLANGASPDWIVTDSVIEIGRRAAVAMRQLLPRMV